MKKLVLGAVAAATVAVPLAVAPAIAGATGGSTPPANSVYIEQYADYGLSGMTLDLGLQVRCTGGGLSNMVTGEVSQYPPETAAPVTLSAGFTNVVCDGKTRPVGLTVDGVGYDNGRAKATVRLMKNGVTTITATKWITIVSH